MSGPVATIHFSAIPPKQMRLADGGIKLTHPVDDMVPELERVLQACNLPPSSNNSAAGRREAD